MVTVNMPSRAYELLKQLHASPGMAYVNRRKLRAFTFNIFSGNYAELKKAYEFIENPENGIKLMSEAMRDVGVEAHMEVMRLFHNFLASAKTLIDHTRVFVEDHYAETAFKRAYDQKIKTEFASDPLMKFIQDLRNYMLHRRLPSGSISLSITHISESKVENAVTTISIDKEKLLTWNNWTQPSRTYLDTLDKQIRISQITNAYGKKVSTLYEWFDRELFKYHEPEIRAFDKLQKEYLLVHEQEAAAGRGP